MFVGFFLPGDSLLVIAGVLAYKGFLNLYWLLGLVTLCAIAGDQLGYFIGWRAGATLFQRQDSRFFKRSHLERAHEFYERNGGKTVIMARFVPIIRTFCPPVAGAAKMNYAKYLTFDVVGGFAWVWSMVLFGYGVVASFPALGQHVDLLVLGVIFVSLIPAALHARQEWKRNKAARV
jgi:membrane-associated protein